MIEMLIVDDDYMSYLQRFRTAFRGEVQFSAVDNGVKGADLFQRKRFEGVILDYDMPHDGYQTALKMKAHSPNIPLIGFSVKWDERLALELNLFAYSSKEENIAKAVAQLCRMDDQTFSKKIKPYFSGR